jgi:4-hydroxy-2-oxoglutarate aldolase
MLNEPIKGVIPPMMTPFKENGDVDFDGHAFNMEKWNEDQLCGYLVLGSNSETAYLNEAEKLRLIELTVKHARKGRLVLAGTGMESARETIALTNKAADLGVRAVLVLTPSYYFAKMNDEAQIAFFSEVADHTRIPVLIYNVTPFTHINISAQAVSVLSRHPNIIGMKDSTGNVPQLVNFQRVMDDGFNLILGTVSAWYPALTLGVEAGIFAMANCAPNECALVQRAFDDGDHDKARETYRRIFPANAAVTATFGIAGLKYASDLMGYRGGFVRNPLAPIKDAEKAKIEEIFKTAELI